MGNERTEMMNNDIQNLTRTGGTVYYIYTHARPDGSIFYVGKGVGDRARDWHQRSDYHKRIVAKHGRENIKVCAYPTHDEAHAYAAERRLILAMRKAGLKLINTDDGGVGRIGVRLGEEQRARISAALMGHPVSEETKARQLLKKKGVPHSAERRAKQRGRDLTKQIEAMRAANTGRKRAPEVGAKITAALTGRKLTPEHCAKIGDSKRGIKWSPEVIAKRAAGIKAAWARRKALAAGAEA